MGRNKSLQKLLDKIEQADDYELNEIVKAIIRRYGRICTDWEVVFLCLPKNHPEEWKKQLGQCVDFSKKYSHEAGKG